MCRSIYSIGPIVIHMCEGYESGVRGHMDEMYEVGKKRHPAALSWLAERTRAGAGGAVVMGSNSA